jgi:hypothetical protein
MLRYSPMILPSALSSRYSNLNSSWVTITSPFHADHLGDVGGAARAVAQALDLDDEVDRVRDLAEMASFGTLMSDIITMFSIRARHSRGELEWSVHIEPSWPVFMAASMSKHSRRGFRPG